MKRRIQGFTLIELLVVIAIIALLISILLPSLSRARELSKRLVCASNIKGVGTSCKIYANDNYEKWMVPPFRRAAIDNGGIEFTLRWNGNVPQGPGQVGKDRWYESTSETPASAGGGSTEVSVTRAYWMMVRSGDITVKQFICPSAGDEADPTQDIDFYYDFFEYEHISYGYQVPFGPRDTRPREGADNRMVFAADKGPWYLETQTPGNWDGPNGRISLEDSPKAWREYNSPNHGGSANGEGQNCLYSDGHATFQRLPAVGIDNDNIYTVMQNSWDATGENRIHGVTPTFYNNPTYPGEKALCNDGAGCQSSTDSLIYP